MAFEMQFIGEPSYALCHFTPRFKPSLIAIERAAEMYHKLQNCLGIRDDSRAPGMYKGQWALFSPGAIAWWHEVRWMPRLEEGWHRLTFRQFLELYRITLY